MPAKSKTLFQQNPRASVVAQEESHVTERDESLGPQRSRSSAVDRQRARQPLAPFAEIATLGPEPEQSGSKLQPPVAVARCGGQTPIQSRAQIVVFLLQAGQP